MSQLQDPLRAAGPATTAEQRGSGPVGRRYAATVAGLTAAAFVACLIRLGVHGLGRDELFSIYIATRPIGHAWSIVTGRELNMGLYYVLLWIWARASQSETWVLGFSVVAATASVPMTAALARRLFGRRVALVAASLTVASPFLLYYGRFARTYALTVFLATLSCWCLLRAVDRRTARSWAAYVAATVLLVLGLPLALLLVAAQGLALLTAPREVRVRPTTLAAVYGAVALLTGPVVARLALGQSGMTAWIPPLSLARIAGAASTIAGGPVLLPVAAVAVLAWLVAVVRGADLGARHPLTRSLVTTWLVLPAAALVAVSVVRPLLVGRYLAPVFPVLPIVLGWLITRIRPRRLMVAALGVVLLLSVGSTVQRVYLAPVPEDMRGAAFDVAHRARPGDAILYVPGHLREGIDWYLHHAGRGAVVPDDVAVRRTPAEMGDEFAEEFAPGEVSRRIEQYRRVWVVTLLGDDWKPVADAGPEVVAGTVRPEYERSLRHSFGLVQVDLYLRR